MPIIAEKLTYITPAGKCVFKDLDFSLEIGEKAGITGNNGTGKSLLINMLSGILSPSSGNVHRQGSLWYVPQHFGQYDDQTVAQALGIAPVIHALRAVANGSLDSLYFNLLENNWDMEERCVQVWEKWKLSGIQFHTPFINLSGGQKTKLLLSAVDIHRPDWLLMDEPSNHLDRQGRTLLLEMLENTSGGTAAVSHDRELLGYCNPVYELSEFGLQKYGGDYSLYESLKKEEIEALQHRVEYAEKAVKKSQQKYRETLQRKQKENAKSKKYGKSGSMPRIMVNAYKDRAEKSTSKLKDLHLGRVEKEREKLQQLKSREQQSREIRMELKDSLLHKGKILFRAEKLNFSYDSQDNLWEEPLDLTIYSGDRIALSGNNGSGKTTLIKLLTGELQPAQGQLDVFTDKFLLIDQAYGLIDRQATVLEQAVHWNKCNVPEHELKTFLTHCLFEKDSWDRSCAVLSGGEMLRLSLCCMVLSQQHPDVVILDEPTNNIDIRNLKLLTQTFAAYSGTLIVISHDLQFLEETGIKRSMILNKTLTISEL